MNEQAIEIRIPGLTKLDQLELKKQLGSEDIRFEEALVDDGDHGELATVTAIVIVTLAALKALSVWAARTGTDITTTTVTETVDEHGRPQKVTETCIIKSTGVDAEALKQLGTATNVDVSPLLA